MQGWAWAANFSFPLSFSWGTARVASFRHAFNRAGSLSIAINFPLSTFLVNGLGCFAMGVLAGWFTFRGEDTGQMLRLLLTTGFFGGFTTFSALSLDAALP